MDSESPPSSRLLGAEALIVLALSFLPSIAYAIVSLAERPVRGARVALNTASVTWAEGARDVIGIFAELVIVALILYLLARNGERTSDIGIDAREPARDLLTGGAIAIVVGGAGLALYLVAFHFGLSRAVIPVENGGAWWQIPILLLSALRSGMLEEVVIVGYLTRRLTQLGWQRWPVVFGLAVVRGSYHLYQGYGAFVGNFVMGVLFVQWRLSNRRTVPLIIAHTLIDAVTFVGWIALRGRATWLPR